MKRLDELGSLSGRRGPLEWMRWIPAALLALLVGVALLIGGNVILIPLLCSLALAYLLEPVVEWFERRGWSRATAVLLTLTAATLVGVLALVFVLPSIWDQLLKSYEQLPRALDAGHRALTPLLEKVKRASPPAYDYLVSLTQRFKSPEQQAQFGNTVGRWLQSGFFKLADATTSIFDLLLIPFFVYYLLSDYLKMRARLELMIPPRYRTVATDLFNQINFALSAYVRSQLLIALIMGLLYALGFEILRVPLALTLGLLSGLLNFIPYLGTLTGLTLALSFTALDGAGAGRLLGVLAVFGIVQSVEGYYLTPRLLGSKLNLHPLLVLLGLVIGGNLFGLLGIILAVPVIATAKVVFNYLEDEVYQKSDFYLRPGVSLLTEEGQLISLPSAPALSTEIPPGQSSDTPERRIILTTGEIRARLSDTDKPGNK